MQSKSPTELTIKTPLWHHLIVLGICFLCYVPFINQAIHIDSDMMVHTARQIAKNPINPQLGEYGRHMVLHDHTNMPKESVWYRCHHPPLIPLLLAPVAAVAGTAEWPFHAVYFLFFLACVYGGWVLFGLYLSPSNRFIATLLWTTCPALMVNSHAIMWDVPITTLMLWAFVFFIKGLRTDRAALFITSGIFTGLAAVAKVNSIPLILVFGFFLLYQRKWKMLVAWSIPVLIFPLAWVTHNLIEYGKIQYISTGQTSFLLGDLRYRFERFVSFMGGVVVLPPFLFWLVIRFKRLQKTIIPFAIFAVAWGVLLVLVLKKPAWVGMTYAVFSCVGFWLFAEIVNPTGPGWVYRKKEQWLVGAYMVVSYLVLLILPSASVRYMLPVIPFAIVTLVTLADGLARFEKRLFWILVFTLGVPFSMLLSIADYQICDADRQLPARLTEKGFTQSNTWYFGRLSFDYYLFQAGFRNARAEQFARPQSGEYAVAEEIPGDYKLTWLSPLDIVEPVDTISLYQFPLRTKGFYAGFYGNDRLPYALKFNAPQKEYIIYKLHLYKKDQ